MSWRKKVSKESPNVGKAFANWLAQLLMMIMPRKLYLIAGRGSAKTTEFQAERLIEMAYDMPGAPVAWVSDTYSNLQKNVLPVLMEGLERKGFKEGVHYIVGKTPPVYTEDEKPDLPSHIKKHFWKPFNKLATYKHTLIFFTGFNVTFGSLDRPASLAGRSYVHVFGDETKYFPEHKIANILKAARGYKQEYGNSPFYLGHTFTTDMPNPQNIGEHDWMLKQAKKLNSAAIMLVVKIAFVLNEALQEWIVAKEENDQELAVKKRRTYQRWYERWVTARQRVEAETFYYVASSYVNADILEPAWFRSAEEDDLGDLQTAVLSMKASMESGERFYTGLEPRHFYTDGTDEVRAEMFGIKDKENCNVLKYLNKNKVLEAGMDFGNMMSMTIAQPSRDPNKRSRKTTLRVLKFLYTLSPETIPHLAKEFREYFAPQKEKTLHLYYDRAGNNYKKSKQDLASQMKRAIEYETIDGKEVKTGWKVVLMSENQGNIGMNEEYWFMQELFGGTNPGLPDVLIDMYNCKPLKCSLELAPTKKNRIGQIVKDKASENKPIKKLPLESTNPSDSFKYLLMRREYRNKVHVRRNSKLTSDPTIRG